MNMTDIATWGQLISSAAVLVTLVYWPIETRQNSAMQRSASRQAMFNGTQAEINQAIDNADIVMNYSDQRLMYTMAIAKGLRSR